MKLLSEIGVFYIHRAGPKTPKLQHNTISASDDTGRHMHAARTGYLIVA